MTAEVKVYSTTFCPYCVRAKQLLERKGVAYTEVNLDKEEPEVRLELMKKPINVLCHKFLLMSSSLVGLTSFTL